MTQETNTDANLNTNIDTNIDKKPAPKKVAQETPKIDAPKYEPAPKIVQKRGGIGFFTALLMSSCAAIGGAYLSLYINARPDIAETLKISALLPKAKKTDNLLAINDEIAKLKTDISALQKVNIGAPAAPALPQSPSLPNNPQTLAAPPVQAPAQIPQQIANLDPLKDQINGLSGRLTAIETRLAALDPTGTGGAIIAALQAEIATLKVNFEALNSRVSQTPSPAVTFAVISLAEAANKNGAFVPEFEAVRAALPNLKEVLALEPLSKTGAPTRSLLENEFENLVKNAVAAKEEVKKQSGVLGWFKNLFSGLVKVKVKEENNPNSDNAIFERTKIKLIAGDLNGAVQELNTIATKSPETIKWLNGANSRLDLEAKVASLRGAIERGLSVSPISQTGANGILIAPKAANDTPPVAPVLQTPNNQIAAPIKGNAQ